MFITLVILLILNFIRNLLQSDIQSIPVLSKRLQHKDYVEHFQKQLEINECEFKITIIDIIAYNTKIFSEYPNLFYALVTCSKIDSSKHIQRQGMYFLNYNNMKLFKILFIHFSLICGKLFVIH